MNIVCIFADQMHRYAMGCMNNPDVTTPNLDRLAREGVLFTNAYSNNPVCSPFRVHLMTGKYSRETDSLGNGCRVPKDCITLPDQLNDADFETSFVGKWHVGDKGNKPIPEELRAGFRHFIGYQCYNGFQKDVCFYDEQNREHRFDRHRTEVATDLALERLGRLAGSPFYLLVGYQAPHYPEQPLPEFEEMYRNAPVHHRPNYCEGVEPFTPTLSPPSPEDRSFDPDNQRYGGDMDEYVRLYNAMVTQIDRGVGRLIDRLKELGLYEDTAIVFTADHGDMQGAHGLVNKCKPHEESAGIPLIASVPGQRDGRVVEAPVSGIDLYPTVLDLAGVQSQAKVSGISVI